MGLFEHHSQESKGGFMPESTLEEVTTEIIKTLEAFKQQEFGNRLSEFSVEALKAMIKQELNKLKGDE
jgi:hypothetical protein